MRQQEIQCLSDIYSHYQETKSRFWSVSLVTVDPLEKEKLFDSLDVLGKDGFIERCTITNGYCDCKLTIKGIEFVENGFREPSPAPAVQGDNNIIVTGTSNTVSGNYNQFSVELQQADLPPECKELIEAFLYEMQNPHLTSEKRSSKIKDFLCDISSGTISGVASAGLTTLLSLLLSQVFH